MTEDKLNELIDEKFDAALKGFNRTHKFFVTENGRGVCDGGDLYNKVFVDVLEVVKVATKDVLKEALK